MSGSRPSPGGPRWAPPLVVWAALVSATPVLSQELPVGRDAALALEFEPLAFQPPSVRAERVGPDVPVLFFEDRALPLVTVHVRFRGGYGLFPRERYAAATAMPGLLRTGGTDALSPDSLDSLLESLAVQVSVGSGGGSVSSSLNSLTATLDQGLELWTRMLTRPRFDSSRIEVWRGRELESVRRRRDDPRRLAFSEFNRIMYGNHPVGWEMAPDDLAPERLHPDRFFEVHRDVVCRQNMVLGITGDLTWEQARERAQALVDAVPDCPGALPEPPVPSVRREAGVFLIPRELDQATVVMAHVADVRLADEPDYFASRVGNSILGGGGFSSRLMARVRTAEGLAYGASSLWTTPRRTEGLVGALTQTRSDATVDALEALLDVMRQVREAAPSPDEVSLAVDRVVNGFVFNFQSPAQVVARQVLYRIQDLPPDWLSIYVRGIQEVSPDEVQAVFRRHLRPDEMTILVVGPQALAPSLARFGPVRIWPVDGAEPSGVGGLSGQGPHVDGRDAEGL